MKLLLITIFLLRSVFVEGQTIDSAAIRIVYKLTYLPDSTKKDKLETDTYFLLIGKKTSCFFSYTKFRQDSMFNESVKNGTVQEFLKDPGQRNKFGNGGFYSNSSLFINYPENKITTTDKIVSSKYIYEEDKELINWEIAPDTMKILSYPCQKAIATFRGRQYIAWFSQQIPIASGPYKFNGLPGLILKIADSRNNYVYDCIAIESMGERQAMAIQKNNYIKTTRSEFRKALKYFFENPWGMLMGTVTVTLVGQTPSQSDAVLKKSIPYNPIELE